VDLSVRLNKDPAKEENQPAQGEDSGSEELYVSVFFHISFAFFSSPPSGGRGVLGAPQILICGESGGNGRTYDLAERYRFCDPFAERECKGSTKKRGGQ